MSQATPSSPFPDWHWCSYPAGHRRRLGRCCVPWIRSRSCKLSRVQPPPYPCRLGWRNRSNVSRGQDPTAGQSGAGGRI